MSATDRPSRRVSAGWIVACSMLAALAGASSAPAAEPKPGGTLTLGLAQDPIIVDPLRTGSFTERQFGATVYESLFDVDEKGKVVPFLAESYEVSPDGKVYTIKLRPGITFHDGTPLNAQAVVLNVERVRNPANGCRCLSQVSDIDAVKALDDTTVEFRLKEPSAAFTAILADAAGIMVSPTAFQADPTGIGTKPVGTGPFKFVEWIKSSRFVVEKYPNYWREGRPYLDRLILRGMQNPETAQAALLSGQLDMLLQPSFRFAAQMIQQNRFVVRQPGGFGYDGVYMNLSVGPLKDVRVRRAIAHAMNRELLRKAIGHGIPELAYSPFGPGMEVHQPVKNYPEYDLAKAQALIAEYGQPVSFTLSFNNTPTTQLLAQSLQEMWRQAGISVTLQALDQNRLVQNMSSKQFEVSLYRFTGRVDPHINTFPFFHSRFAEQNPSSNYVHYANPEVDRLLEEGNATLDPAARKKIYGQLSEILAQDLPYAFLFYVADQVVMTKKIHGVPLIPDGLIRFADVWVE